jgi:predicted restriction endonuclease
MPGYACIKCGKVSDQRRCPLHRGKHTGWSPERNRMAQARFRDTVLSNAGYRCEHMETTGIRCPIMGPRNLIAHHVTPLADGGSDDATNGQALCSIHHRTVDAKAR